VQRSRPAQVSCRCLYQSQSICCYIHIVALISEGRFVRSPIDIDREQGPVGNGGPFLLRALRLVTAGAFGFFSLVQSGDRPDRYGRSRRLATMPSSPNLHACWKTIAPSAPSICSDSWIPLEDSDATCGRAATRALPEPVGRAYHNLAAYRARHLLYVLRSKCYPR
jgi:hypothetical protein